jgi:polar amino acid transport system substrate-binding protein
MAAALVGACAMTFAACGTPTATSEQPGASGSASGAASATPVDLLPKDDAIAALVPQKIRDKGTIVFATDATAPPNQFIAEDGTTIIGNEVDFGNQLGSILGLKVEWVNVSFDSIIPGLQAARYDTALSGMRVTLERQKLVDFVSYAKTGPQLFAKKENADKISTPEELCGHSIAVQSATIQADAIADYSKKCEAAGKPAIDIKTFKNQNDQINAVASGQAEFGVQNAPNNVYLATQTEGALVGFGKPFLEGPWGMPIPKETGLTNALYEATKKLVASPQYTEILKFWKNADQAITVDEVKINGAVS